MFNENSLPHGVPPSKLNHMLIGTLAVMTSKKFKQMQLCDEFLLAMNGVIA